MPTTKVLLIGWDAADWKVITPLMEAGKNLAAEPYLDEALTLATSVTRKADIRKRLAIISGS